MVDRLFSEPKLAALYDAVCRGRPDFRFYLPLVMAADAVLDVGCGTGELLRWAREQGHPGRLCGLDPADAMLDVARRRSDIEWVLADARSMRFAAEFDLVVMTGHAFQVFVEDDDVGAVLAAARAALTPGGRVAFETRNPLARAWEGWTPDNAVEVHDSSGQLVRLTHEVVAVEGERVSFTSTFTSPGWELSEVSQSTLRFTDADSVSRLLCDAGLVIEEQFGDWDRSSLGAASLEIITIARLR